MLSAALQSAGRGLSVVVGIELVVVRGTDSVVVGRQGPFGAGIPVMEPFAGPDPVESPALALKLFLAEPVTVSCALGRVVCGAVAFDRQDVTAWLDRMLDGKVDPVGG